MFIHYNIKNNNILAKIFSAKLCKIIDCGRNIALNLVKTKYFLLLDDDFFFYTKTDLTELASVLESTDASIVGGEHRVGRDLYCDYYGIFRCVYKNDQVNAFIQTIPRLY
ncbi:hypothetical protein HZS_7753 [Henneguya salminicola]|nr:hypothetical protein HZS_7753 [Henneguya salminicola]